MRSSALCSSLRPTHGPSRLVGAHLSCQQMRAEMFFFFFPKSEPGLGARTPRSTRGGRKQRSERQPLTVRTHLAQESYAGNFNLIKYC